MGTAALVTPEELLAHEITVFNDRVRVDVQTSTPGLDFPSAWQRRVTMWYHGQAFYVVSREDLIASSGQREGLWTWKMCASWNRPARSRRRHPVAHKPR